MMGLTKMRLLNVAVLGTVLVSVCLRPARATDGSYAVVIHQETFADPNWRPVAETLLSRHNGKIVTWDDDIAKVLAGLRAIFPRYACFICTPEQATREFVRDVHRLTRRLDDDPYTDVIWGILTGYDAGNALQVARSP